MFRKILDFVGLSADLAPGAVLIAFGMVIIAGAITGALW
jgi:hypothetical protein